jgi:NADH:ubiquinone oxidoreductase subunit 3 (subunit A)
MLSTFGIILSVIIIIALAASGAFVIIAKFEPNIPVVKKLSFLNLNETAIIRYLETKQKNYFIVPILLILFIIEISLITPIFISGFYFQPFFWGILTAMLFNSILIPALIFLWKNGSLETLNSRFVIYVIDSFKNKFIKK